MSRFIPILLFVGLFSCDCSLTQYGKVLDAETKQPIEGAKISISKWTETTSETGEFEFTITTNICPDRIVLVEMEGYKPFKMEIRTENNQHQYLVESDYGYHEYNEPISSNFNPKIKEQGSYFDLYSTKFEAPNPDSIVFLLTKNVNGM